MGEIRNIDREVVQGEIAKVLVADCSEQWLKALGVNLDGVYKPNDYYMRTIEFFNAEYQEPIKITKLEKELLELYKARGFVEISLYEECKYVEIRQSDRVLTCCLHEPLDKLFRFKKTFCYKIDDLLENAEVIEE